MADIGPPGPARNPWVTRSSNNVYSNDWIQLTHHEVITPGGSPGVYGVVKFAHRAVGVLPLDGDNHTWLVGQYRFACEEFSWEIPAGGGLADENPIDTARRELREEVGLEAGSVERILTARLSNSVTDEMAYIHIATDLSPCEKSPDDTELLEIRRVPLTDAIAWAKDGTITDAISIMALLSVDSSGNYCV